MASEDQNSSLTPPSFPTIGLTKVEVGVTMFERFVLRKELGRGAMGQVFAAEDIHLRETVALKFVHDFLRWSPGIMEALAEEVVRTRHLSHSHIVRVYELHRNALSAAIAMEYVDGQSLHHLISCQKEKCLPPGEILVWLPGLIDALTYAHETAGVVHRDLKPANILVSGKGVAKITDFGLARRTNDELSLLSQAQPTGTLPFMSPQQLVGEKASVADDVYSLGATLYYCLTGTPPFYTGYLPHQIETRMPDSLSGRRRTQGIRSPALPGVWEETVGACLAKDPADRPASVREVSLMLEGKVRRKTPRRLATPSGETSHRKKYLAGALTLTVLAIGIFALGYIYAGQLAKSGPPGPATLSAETASEVIPSEELILFNPEHPLPADAQPAILLGALSRNLVLHLPLERNTRDYSGYGWDGIGVNLATTLDRFGQSNRAIQFLGNSTIRVDFPPDLTFSIGRPFAISFWIQTDLQEGMLWSLLTRSNAHPSLALNYHLDGLTLSTSGGRRDNFPVVIPALLEPGSWHYLVVQYTGREFEVYLDGGKILTHPYAIDPSLSDGWSLRLGGAGYRRRHFAGAMNDFRLYRSTLPQSQITTNLQMLPHRPRITAVALPRAAERFALTRGIYSEKDDLDLAVRREFGENARMADWETIREYFYDTGAQFARWVGLDHSAAAFVTRGGKRLFSDNRHYAFWPSEGTFRQSSLNHDHTAEGELLLGSWFDIEYPILVEILETPPGETRTHLFSRFAPGDNESRTSPWHAEASIREEMDAEGRLYAIPGEPARRIRHHLPHSHEFKTLRAEFVGFLGPSEWGSALGIELICMENGAIPIRIEYQPTRQSSFLLRMGSNGETHENVRLMAPRFGEFDFTLLARAERVYFSASARKTTEVLFEETFSVPGFCLSQLVAVRWMVHSDDPTGEPPWISHLRLTAR